MIKHWKHLGAALALAFSASWAQAQYGRGGANSPATNLTAEQLSNVFAMRLKGAAGAGNATLVVVGSTSRAALDGHGQDRRPGQGPNGSARCSLEAARHPPKCHRPRSEEAAGQSQCGGHHRGRPGGRLGEGDLQALSPQRLAPEAGCHGRL